MTTATNPLPINDTLAPASQEELASLVRECDQAETPIYPIGGGTSLNFGRPAVRPGVGLSLAGLASVIDYPAADMTITVEAGITMGQLSATLAEQHQRLPIDVPQAATATLGGVIATNFNGPRRLGLGTVRDYVIGIRAVDGRGETYNGGGRVVKNVAGYDFCKLLTGSLGTLGVITQVTLKVKPQVEQSVLMATAVRDLDHAEQLLAALVHSGTTPVAVELLSGAEWSDAPGIGPLFGKDGLGLVLVVGLEGTAPEVVWMRQQLASEWSQLDASTPVTLEGKSATEVWQRLTEFPAAGEAQLVLLAALAPSAVTRLIAAAREVDAAVAIQAHAGSGVVRMKFAEFPAGGLSRSLTGKLAPVAGAGHGHIVVLANATGAEMTPQSVWGGIDVPFWLMTKVKEQFDPRGILNPDRFVYV